MKLSKKMFATIAVIAALPLGACASGNPSSEAPKSEDPAVVTANVQERALNAIGNLSTTDALQIDLGVNGFGFNLTQKTYVDNVEQKDGTAIIDVNGVNVAANVKAEGFVNAKTANALKASAEITDVDANVAVKTGTATVLEESLKDGKAAAYIKEATPYIDFSNKNLRTFVRGIMSSVSGQEIPEEAFDQSMPNKLHFEEGLLNEAGLPLPLFPTLFTDLEAIKTQVKSLFTFNDTMEHKIASYTKVGDDAKIVLAPTVESVAEVIVLQSAASKNPVTMEEALEQVNNTITLNKAKAEITIDKNDAFKSVTVEIDMVQHDSYEFNNGTEEAPQMYKYTTDVAIKGNVEVGLTMGGVTVAYPSDLATYTFVPTQAQAQPEK